MEWANGWLRFPHASNIVSPPTPQSASSSHEPPRAPRLTSPRLLRDIFPSSTSGNSLRPELPLPVPDDDFDNTLRDVQSALHNADMALRNAQAAFRHGRSTRSNASNVVDLTGSDEIPDPSAEGNTFGVGSYVQQRHNDDAVPRGEAQRRTLSIHHLLHPIINSASAVGAQADRTAVRRQRQARRDWERVEARNRARAQQHTQQQEPNRRRRRRSRSTASEVSDTSTVITNPLSPSEPVDLTGADDESTLQTILAQEQQEAIAAQPKPSTNTSSKDTPSTSLANYKCAICMDAPTNATTTICGHLFCHRCILDSLKWSERQRREDMHHHNQQINGLCPVCRKPLKNKEVSASVRGTSGGLVSLEIKKVPRKQYNDDRAREKFLADMQNGKGKQRANTEDDVTDIANLDVENENEKGEEHTNSRGLRKRRRGQT